MTLSRYTERQLSYDKDTLPALEGLANAFHRTYTPEDTYHSGIWRNDLFRGLLWMIKDSSLSVRPSQAQFPSWSWASVRGEIEWPTRTTARHCHYKYTVSFAKADSSGAPAKSEDDGVIKLYGRYQLLDEVMRPQEWGAFGRFPLDVVSGGQVIANGAFDIDSEIQANDIWVLQIEVQGPGDSYFPYHPTCLLLKQVDGSTAITFSRVGYCAMNEDSIRYFDDIELELIHIV